MERKIGVKHFFIALITAFVFSNCSNSSKEGDPLLYSGLYKSNNSDFGELFLDPSGSYTHTFLEKGTKRTNSGMWVLEKTNGEVFLSFSQFIWPSEFLSTLGGFWLVQPNHSWGKVRLPIDLDRNYFFYKKSVL